jgi:hypothetical protein
MSSNPSRGEEKLADVQGFVRLVDFLRQKASPPQPQSQSRISKRALAIEKYRAQRDLFTRPLEMSLPGATEDLGSEDAGSAEAADQADRADHAESSAPSKPMDESVRQFLIDIDEG